MKDTDSSPPEKLERKFSTISTLEAAYLIYCGAKPTKQTRKAGAPVRMYFDLPRRRGRALVQGLYTQGGMVNARSFARALYSVHGYNQTSMRGG